MRVSGSGWQSGISSAVRFAAMIPASCAVTSASPFGSSRRRRAVSGGHPHARRRDRTAPRDRLRADVDHANRRRTPRRARARSSAHVALREMREAAAVRPRAAQACPRRAATRARPRTRRRARGPYGYHHGTCTRPRSESTSLMLRELVQPVLRVRAAEAGLLAAAPRRRARRRTRCRGRSSTPCPASMRDASARARDVSRVQMLAPSAERGSVREPRPPRPRRRTAGRVTTGPKTSSRSMPRLRVAAHEHRRLVEPARQPDARAAARRSAPPRPARAPPRRDPRRDRAAVP